MIQGKKAWYSKSLYKIVGTKIMLRFNNVRVDWIRSEDDNSKC